MEKRSRLLLITFAILLSCLNNMAFTMNYNNINFREFKKTSFQAETEGIAYYDSFNIYYKSYDYQEYECITEYYLVGSKQGKEEIIMYCCFENNNSQLVTTRYDAQGTALLSTNISGYLHYEDRNVYSHSDIEVYGFSDEIFEYPFIVSLLYIANYKLNGQYGQMQTGDLWPMEYDYENNILRKWSPE